MPGARTPGPSVKDPDQYEALRRQGDSKEKAARIANASARRGRSAVAAKGGRASRYEDMTKPELLERARVVGLSGRSSMTKGQLISALRGH